MISFSLEKLGQIARHKPPGYAQDVLSRATVNGDMVSLTRDAILELRKKYPTANTPAPRNGVGTELKKLLSKIGITATPGCVCNKRAAIMDQRGVEWCEQNVETICDWLQEEATKRKLPFVRLAGKAIIHLAIKRAKKNNSK